MPATNTLPPVARLSGRGVPDGDGPSNVDLIRLRDVCQRTTLSASTLYQMILMGQFPRPAALGPRAKAWPEYAIDAWLASRIAARDAMLSPHDRIELPAWDPEMEYGNSQHGIRMMRRAAVVRRAGFRRSHIYRLIGDGLFPAPVPIGVRARAWVQSEVDEWVLQRIDARRTDPGFRYLTARFSVD